MKHILITIAAVVLVGCEQSAIHDAAAAGDLAAIQAELDKGVDVNAKDNDGRTPLHYAAKYATKEVVELLIPNGADVNVKDRFGFTPLREAAWYGHKEIAELLLDKGTDVNAKGGPVGRTPLHEAVLRGHKEIADLLIANGADVNAKDNYGATPLDWAIDDENADLLRKHGGKTAEELEAEGK